MVDIVSNFQQGLAFGQQQRAQKQAQQDKQQLRNLAPAILQGDPEAYSQAAVIDPQAAQTYQDAGDRDYRRLTNVIGIMQKAIDSDNPVAKQTAFRTITPYLKQLTGGRPVPEQWDDSLLPGFEQLKQRVAMAEQGGNAAMPTGFRQFQLTAEAAGLKPGSPEYQQAARIALGSEGRASSAGYGFKEVLGADGKPRIQRNNPRTGAVEIYDEATGNFTPIGGQPQQGFGISETDNYVKSILSRANVDPNASPEVQAQQLLPYLIQQESGGNPNAVSPKGAQGLTQVMPATGRDPGFGVQPLQDNSPQENVRFGREYLTAMLSRYPGRPDLALAAYNAGPGVADRFANPQASRLAVGRAPEEQAAATTAAQEAARLQYLPAELGYKTQAAINEAQGVGAVKGQQEIANKTAEQRAEKERSADSVLSLTEEAKRLLPSAGGGRFDQLVNAGANIAGISTEQSRANRQLKVIAGGLTAAQPKMSGPQSDKDVQLYREMAGDVANESLPIADRQAAIQVIERLQKKYTAPKESGRTVVRRGTANGRPVVQYSDGTIDYAD